MKKSLLDLVGAKVQNFEEVLDYWQLVTDKGTINIYNPAKFLTSQGNHIEMKEVAQLNFTNIIIKNVYLEIEKIFRLEFSDEKVLETSLEDKDYYGPEAISIHYNSGETIVIN
jgi:hypothetical protein